MKYNVLLLGGGGREHALAWGISKSSALDKLFIAPGNPGTEALGENVDLDINNFEEVYAFTDENSIHLVIVGPEQPLVDGLVDYLEDKCVAVFGPKKIPAQLEGSKEFAKNFMQKKGIPTADFKVFDQSEFDKAANYFKEKGKYPVVLKADGLAAGKGVLIPESEEEALGALQELKNGSLSSAAQRLVVEEFMEGEEASVFAICDGDSYKIIGNAQDHKRIGEGDVGLNTGGMGAYSPTPILTTDLMNRVEDEIIAPTISGMKADGNPYSGILYVGLMITKDGPKVVEYNCRFGDPECQVIVPSLKSDLLDVIIACTEGRLSKTEIQFDGKHRCAVVLASGGYPESYEKGKEITGLESVNNAIVFHAGTRKTDDKIVTNGGRVLNVVAEGKSLKEAIENAYSELSKIHFDKAYFRRDIGAKGLKHIQ